MYSYLLIFIAYSKTDRFRGLFVYTLEHLTTIRATPLYVQV